MTARKILFPILLNNIYQKEARPAIQVMKMRIKTKVLLLFRESARFVKVVLPQSILA